MIQTHCRKQHVEFKWKTWKKTHPKVQEHFIQVVALVIKELMTSLYRRALWNDTGTQHTTDDMDANLLGELIHLCQPSNVQIIDANNRTTDQAKRRPGQTWDRTCHSKRRCIPSSECQTSTNRAEPLMSSNCDQETNKHWLQNGMSSVQLTRNLNTRLQLPWYSPFILLHSWDIPLDLAPDQSFHHWGSKRTTTGPRPWESKSYPAEPRFQQEVSKAILQHQTI